jgi:serine/threonine protein kinase
MSALPDTRAVSISAAGYADGLGRRSVRFDREVGGMLECLHLRPELWAFESNLRSSASVIASLDDERFVRVRGIERDARGLTVISELLPGQRLADIIETRQREEPGAFGIDASLGFLLQLLPALSTLHTLSMAHGAVDPGRILVTGASQIVLLDGIYGAALERLNLSRSAMWTQLGILAPPFAGAPRFDRQSDVAQAALCALALAVGRVVDGPGDTALLAPFVREFRVVAEIRAGDVFANRVQQLFTSLLPSTTRRDALSADEAAAEAEHLAEMIGEEGCHAAFAQLARFDTTIVLPQAPAVEDDLFDRFDEIDEPDAAESESIDEAVTVTAAVDPPVVVRDVSPAPTPEPTPAVVPPPVSMPPIPAAAPPPAPAPAPAQAPVMPAIAPAGTMTSVSVQPKPPSPTGWVPVPPPLASPPPAAEAPALPPPAPPVFPTVPSPAAYATPRVASPAPAVTPIRVVAPPPVPAAPHAPVTQPIGVMAPSPAPLRVRSEPPAGFAPARVEAEPPVRALPFVDRAAPATAARFPWKLAAAAVIVLTVGIVAARPYLAGTGDLKPVTEAPAPAAAPAPPPPAAATTGGIVVDTQPSGAKVTLDGVDVGVTPLTLDSVAPGKHTVVVATDTATVKRAVRVEAGKTVSLDVPVYSGWVSVFSPIPLDIAEGGKTLGNTDTGKIILPPGRHLLTLSNTEFGYTDTRTVDIQSGEERPLNVEPKGVVNVNAHPWAEVWIDGKKAGDTPIANLTVLMGTRVFLFKHPQYGERKVTVTVKSAPEAVSVDFTKS